MNNKHNAKYAFYYLLSLVSLIFISISVGLIAFGIIDITIPDTLKYYYNSSFTNNSFRFAISALLIATPIFYYLSFLINKGLRNKELDKESGIRRWLTYFIIFVSSVTILGVFISLINNFLSGELTSRFLFKALSVLIISGSVFSFYFYDIKRDNPEEKNKVIKIFFYSSLAIILTAFISVWFFVDSPKEARMRRLDQNLLTNINILENTLNSFYADKGFLPDDISEIKNSNYYYELNSFVDPETGTPIEYNKLSDRDFELCATFRLDSEGIDRGGRNVVNPIYGPSDKNSYKAGYSCLKGNLWMEKEAKPVETKNLENKVIETEEASL